MENISNKVLVSHYSGSIAYGTKMPNSDIDIRGIFMYDPLSSLFEYPDEMTHNIKGSDDGKLIELRKFIKLALSNNPNILETLFIEDKHMIESSEEYQYLWNNRYKFLSKRIFNTYSGYAYAQIKKLNDHNVWIKKSDSLGIPILNKLGLNNIDILKISEDEIEKIVISRKYNILEFAMLIKPRRLNYLKVEYNYTDIKGWNSFNESLVLRIKENSIFQRIDTNLYGIYLLDSTKRQYNPISGDDGFSAFGKEEMIQFLDLNPEISLGKPDLLVKFKQDEYEKDLSQYNGFKSWKETRNSKRLDSEIKFGYDTKFMMHTIRLLSQAKDIALGKGLIVDRTYIDKDYLLNIRNGKFSFEEMNKHVEKLFSELKELEKTSNLPNNPTITNEEIIKHIYSPYIINKFIK